MRSLPSALRWSFVLALAFVAATAPQIPTFSPSPYVYKITANCVNAEGEQHLSMLTGFRVKNLAGIVTALHGVAGCDHITAIQSRSLSSSAISDLVPRQVDIDHDVALLGNAYLDEVPRDGLQVINRDDNSDYSSLRLLGYPYDLYEQKPTDDLSVVRLIQLQFLLSDDVAVEFSARGSPAISAKVLDIQGHLVPGHSGAPLLNTADKVVGVGNGGQDSGRTEMVWAIPWDEIRFKEIPAELSKSDLDRLGRLGVSSALFAAPGTSYQELSQAIASGNTTPSSAPIETVKKFQEARAVAYSTWDISLYYSMLRGEALAASLTLADQIRTADCRYFIGSAEATYRDFRVSPTKVYVYTTRYEEQKRLCGQGSSQTVTNLCLGYQIKYDLEKQGGRWWIVRRSSDLRPLVQCRQQVESETAFKAAATQPLMVTTSDANIRRGPGRGYAVIGGAKSHQQFYITGVSDGECGGTMWWRTEFNGTSGWISGQLVSVENAETVPIVTDAQCRPS